MTKRNLLLSSIVFLSMFYLYVVSRILQPEVSARYRAYYIENNLKYWNDGITPPYRTGTSIDFTQKVPYLSLHGWSSHDTNGTRLISSPASLFLEIDSASSIPAKIIVESRRSTKNHPAKVSVLVNDKPAGNVYYNANEQDAQTELTIPAGAIGNKERNLTITFSADSTYHSPFISIRSMTLNAPTRPDKKFVETVERNGI